MKIIINLLIAIILVTGAIKAQDTLTVTKTTDPNPFLYPYNFNDNICHPTMYGTLQWAVKKANDLSDTTVIAFNIAGSGTHEIALNYGLPQINGRNHISIDGTTQTGWQADQPVIEIDGSTGVLTCFNLYNSDYTTIKGLSIKNFKNQGILLTRSDYCEIHDNVINRIDNGAVTDYCSGIQLYGSCHNIIENNYIGTDRFATDYGNEDYGIVVQHNPAAKVLEASLNNTIRYNIIAENGLAGVWIGNHCDENLITKNSIYNNTEGISLLGGGNISKSAPVITLYNDTIQTIYGTSLAYDVIEIFGSSGSENAYKYIKTLTADASGNWTGNLSTVYSHLIATATDGLNNTSGLSNSQQTITIDYSKTWVSLSSNALPSSPTCTLLEKSNSHLILELETNGYYKKNMVKNGVIYQKISFPKNLIFGEIGSPELPHTGNFIQVPDTNSINITIISEEDTTFAGYNVFPHQEPLPEDSISTVFYKNDSMYLLNGFYPVAPYSIGKINSSRGVLNRWIGLNPVSVNTVTNQLKVKTKIRIRVDFSAPINYLNNHYSQAFEKIHSNMLLNYTPPVTTPTKSPTDYDLLIIYHEPDLQFPHITQQELDKFVDWKRRKGYKTEIVSKDFILNNTSINNPVSGQEDALKIKKFIDNEYDNNHISYVLFISKDRDIPMMYFHIQGSRAEPSPGSADYVYTDIYYGAADDLIIKDYYDDSSSLQNPELELYDFSDFDAQMDIIIGRFSSFDKIVYDGYMEDYGTNGSYTPPSGNSTKQIDNTINKSIDYEMNPPMNNWFNNYLFMAHKQDEIWNFVFTEELDNVVDEINNTFSPQNQYNLLKAYGAGPSLTTPSDQCNNNADVINHIENGVGILNYRGHGQCSSWGGGGAGPIDNFVNGWTWQYTSCGGDCEGSYCNYEFFGPYDGSNGNTDPLCKNEVFHLSNSQSLPIIFSICCNTNAVRSSANGLYCSLGQMFTSGTTNGGVAFYGASGPTGRSFNSTMNEYLFEELLSNGMYNIGDLTTLSSSIANGGSYNKSYISYLWLGDPTLEIWTDIPSQLNANHSPLKIENNTPFDLTVNISGLESGEEALITLYKSDEYNQPLNFYYKKLVTVDAYGNASWTFNSITATTDGDIHVTVTAHNYLPYTGITYAGCGLLKSDQEITANETWSTDRFVNSNVIIKAGNTLAITSKVCFHEDAQITVEKGGKLIVDDGELYTDCGELWEGILVEGNENISQLDKSNHGWLVVRNDGIIRDAKTAVKVEGGGVVYANSGIFKNNQVDFKFEPYSYTNISYFNYCSFLTEGQLHNKAKFPGAHVMLNEVTGIKFTANTFSNDRTSSLPGDPASLYANYKGIGIQANNSGFKVLPGCASVILYGVPCDDPNIIPNTFENLCYGIKANSINPAVSITIQQSEFLNNYRGVLLENINNPTITSNEFDADYTGLGTNAYISYPPQYGNSTYSMYLNACTGYRVEENSFENGDAGLFINESGDLYNEIYKNNYNNIDNHDYASASTALGNNYDNINEVGLEFHCNNYSLSEYNMSVVGNSSMAKYQGSSTKPTGNLSDYDCSQSESDLFIDVASPIPNYFYYYQTGEDLSCFSLQVTQSQSTGSNTCESKLDTASSISVIKSRLISIQDDVDDAQADLYALVDGGDTDEMLDLIDNLSSDNFEEACTILSGIAPYLSDEVLTEFMQVEVDGFEEEKQGVLLDNSPLPEKAGLELESYSLPEEMMDELLAAQEGINTVEEEMMEIAAMQSERQYLLNTMVASALYRDSLSEPKDSIIDFLTEEPGYKANYYLIPLLIENEDYSDAASQLEAFESAIAGSQAEVQEKLLNYIDYLTIVNDYRDNGNDSTVVATNLTFLENLAEEENAPGNIGAQAMLEQYNPENYDFPEKIEYPLEMDNKSLKQNVFIRTSEQRSTKDMVKIYPNPANNKLVVDYYLAEAGNYGELEIFNIYGQKVFSANIKEQDAVLNIDVTSFSNGVYMIVLNKKHKKRLSIMH